MNSRPFRGACIVHRALAAIIGLLAACGLAPTSRSEAPPPVKSWHVEGRVLDATGQPSAGARVSTNQLQFLKSPTATETKTDASGRFRLEVTHRANGRIIRAIDKDGAQLASTRLPYEFEQAASPAPLELQLLPPRDLQCIVVDSNQAPVAGASVLIDSSYEQFDTVETDAAGRALFRLPPDLPLQAVVAMKGGVGLDYWLFRAKDEPKSDPYKLAHDHAEPLKFVLNGARPVTVRVVDDKNQALPDVKVYPWLLKKPNKGSQNEDLNLSGLDISRQTDREGVATFDFIPADNMRPINFWARVEGYHSTERHMFDPESTESEVVARLVPLVRITGQVVHEDGSPAADIEVRAVGDDYAMDGFRESTRTDAAGNFKFNAYPNQYYQFFAGNREFATDPVYYRIVLNQPVDDIKLKLGPAIRVHGQVTNGPNKTPVKSTYLQLYRQDDSTYYKLPENQRLPNPTDSNKAVMPQIVWGAQTDDNGHFEFFVSPGKYYMFGPRNHESIKFELTDQPAHEVNIHSDLPEKLPLKGLVVLKDDPSQRVPEARIYGMALESFAGRHLEAVSDADGRFEAERGPNNMVVFASTSNPSLAGLIKITPDDQSIIIPVSPTGAARGRLVDEETGAPIAQREIRYGISIEFPDGTSTITSGGTVKTDDDGKFEATGLILGEETVFNAVIETDGKGNARSWRKVANATPTGTDPIDLGTLNLEPPVRELTPEERVAKAFTDPRSLDDRLRLRLRDAKLGYQRVLIVAGDPAHPFIQKFYELEHNRDGNQAILNYLLLPISTADGDAARAPSSGPLPSAGREQTSTGDPKSPERSAVDGREASGEGGTTRDAALEFLTQHNILPPAPNDMSLAVLDESGAQLAEASAIDLATNGALDPARVTKFLDAHAVPLPDAETLFTGALARAKQDDKRVLIQVSGPRCGWCFVLSRFLDDHKELVDKEFVYMKLDPRMKNGDAVIERVRPTQVGGIPWMVIYDSDGNPLINSDGPNGNTGYPGEPEGQLHFEKMLRTGAKHLTDEDIKSLLAALAANKL
jgi:hypothetical protein